MRTDKRISLHWLWGVGNDPGGSGDQGLREQLFAAMVRQERKGKKR